MALMRRIEVWVEEKQETTVFLTNHPKLAAVLVQIWTALIAMLLVRYLQFRSTFGWSLSNLVALLRQQLFVYRDLMAWLNQPFEPPPELLAVQELMLELE